MRPIADDDFVICRNARMDIRLCHQVDVSCVLQLIMTLLYVDTHVPACACIPKPTSNASPAGDVNLLYEDCKPVSILSNSIKIHGRFIYNQLNDVI